MKQESAMKQGSANRWRTVDVVVAAVLGTAFGVVFWAWGLLWEGAGNAIPLPARGLIYGVWLVPAVLGPLVIRRPGAGLFTEFVAASVATFFGSPWGLTTLLYGVFQGLAGEFAFAATGYTRWRLPTALAGGALAGGAAVLLDLINYYPANSAGWKWAYAALVILSATAIAGYGAWSLTKALAQTGVLSRFPSAQTHPPV
jgi:energy-coupling factor transport system substrate-specific component